MDVINIGRECFADRDETIISYKGHNYYKACDVKVRELKVGGETHCVKRVGHPGILHEDYAGEVSTGLFEFIYEEDGSLSLDSAVFQALGAASVCWSVSPKGIFESDRARNIGCSLLKFIRGADV